MQVPKQERLGPDCSLLWKCKFVSKILACMEMCSEWIISHELPWLHYSGEFENGMNDCQGQLSSLSVIDTECRWMLNQSWCFLYLWIVWQIWPPTIVPIPNGFPVMLLCLTEGYYSWRPVFLVCLSYHRTDCFSTQRTNGWNCCLHVAQWLVLLSPPLCMED